MEAKQEDTRLTEEELEAAEAKRGADEAEFVE